MDSQKLWRVPVGSSGGAYTTFVDATLLMADIPFKVTRRGGMLSNW